MVHRFGRLMPNKIPRFLSPFTVSQTTESLTYSCAQLHQNRAESQSRAQTVNHKVQFTLNSGDLVTPGKLKMAFTHATSELMKLA
ncbi:uncharacterized protein PHALS_14572 [Plasmopara halstedii]|uniref:Uncharacterized protein n=1 Tax=Plasmopara halstedii TaxID=4781 RepID=A0A0P1AM66_PLAHL|nr:uncharacterized protein PHALS_14572 [Plasmopara halstedii]CEG41823.1 hypothetical protein PHALS_14572 [Plasmopara halstedii]|eukprot:XP_024578192.1 hypothetical protein PHALS_14572 [Plasmopara halstedii]